MTTPPIENLLRGRAGGRLGIFIDHVGEFENRGGHLRNGRWAVLPGGRAYPILCADFTEFQYPEGEGTYTAACGEPTVAYEGQCEHHKAALDTYRAMSPAEQIALEIQEDMEASWR